MEYIALIPVLVNAVKELSAKVTALESAWFVNVHLIKLNHKVR
jgi:hypothetical protein